jgi:hypothetical protein
MSIGNLENIALDYDNAMYCTALPQLADCPVLGPGQTLLLVTELRPDWPNFGKFDRVKFHKFTLGSTFSFEKLQHKN